MFMKNMYVYLTGLTLLMTSSFAQEFSVIPKNALSGVAIKQIGNQTVKKGCEGDDPKYMKVTVRPSCYGANLRGGGATIDPQGGPVKMSLTIVNNGNKFSSDIIFPTKTTWPDNYGQSCSWTPAPGGSFSGHSVSCSIKNLTTGLAVNVNYTCNYKKTTWFLNDTLSCTRNADLAAQGSLNENISCLFFYNWKGTGYAAVSSYTKKSGMANCGLLDAEDLGPQIGVNMLAGSSATTLNKRGTRGEVVVELDDMSINKRSVYRNLTNGEIETSGRPSSVSVRFSQDVGSGSWKILSVKQEVSMHEFEQCLTIKPSFLGTNQFCGSYYSPLMLFFDEELPNFRGISSFPLHPDKAVTNWIEPQSKGHFLVYDKDGDGKITSSKELFGNGENIDNGFEALKAHDLNKDFVIDKKDPIFSKLMLWRDINGNGISEKEELVPLVSKGISSINLYYRDNNIQFQGRAEIKQSGDFTFVKNGRKKKGIVHDVWFSPVQF